MGEGVRGLGFKTSRHLRARPMSEPALDAVDLEAGEKPLKQWAVEPVRTDLSTDRVGWMVLTSHRCLFFPKAGLLGGSRVAKPAAFAWRLEKIRAVSPQRYWMSVGYGDRLEIPGFAIDGQGFRLNRETPARGVLDDILKARQSRRAELGLPLA
jgi:hypothetical protein